MKTNSILFSASMLMLAGTLSACDGKIPKPETSFNSLNAGESRQMAGKSADKTVPALYDSTITAKARWALAAASDLKGINISVETVGGRVTLSGNVASKAESQRAASSVSSVQGVKHVDNRIAVKIYV